MLAIRRRRPARSTEPTLSWNANGGPMAAVCVWILALRKSTRQKVLDCRDSETVQWRDPSPPRRSAQKAPPRSSKRGRRCRRRMRGRGDSAALYRSSPVGRPSSPPGEDRLESLSYTDSSYSSRMLSMTFATRRSQRLWPNVKRLSKVRPARRYTFSRRISRAR